MTEHTLDQYFSFTFTTSVPAGDGTDADALPTYRIYSDDSDTVVATGTCVKRDDSNTVGYYAARGQITTAGGYVAGKTYEVLVTAAVGEVTGSAVVGRFRVVPADTVREDQWTDAKAAFIDAAISSRSTLTAQQVWEYSTRTLSTYGTLVADAAAAVWAVAVRTITGGALTTAPPTKEQIAAQVDTTLTAAHGSGAWVGAAGAGERFVTVTVVDGDGAPVPDACVSLVNTAGTTTLAGPLSTDADGEVVFNRNDEETGNAVVRSTTAYSGGTAAYTVAGNTDVTVTVTAIAVPAPAAAGYCTIVCNDQTQTPDAAVGTFSLTGLVSPATVGSGVTMSNVTHGPKSVALVNGQATLEIMQGATVLLMLATESGSVGPRRVLIPEQTGPVNWMSLADA